jgi:hypothetical protein
MKLTPYKIQRQMVNKFGGYNVLSNAAYNEFTSMSNLTGDKYPYLTVRDRRSMIKELTSPTGFGALEELYYVDGTAFFYNAVNKGAVTAGQKILVNSGAEVLIFPDNKSYNTSNGAYVSLDATFTQSTTATISISKSDGTVYSSYTVSSSPPVSPSSGDVWIDTSGNFDVMKIYSGETELWASISTTYIKIACEGIDDNFSQFDGVTLSGCTNNDLNMDYIIQYIGVDYIILYGLLRTEITQETGLVLTRSIPTIDFATVYNNRVWGCSSTNHEVYASKLGDPKNWNAYEGISTDSYVATIASAGNFTGAITYGGYVMFFKEDCIHRIFGNKPANFEINEIQHQGVKSGCSKSLAVVNGALYYLSINGVMEYTGGYPEVISTKMGNMDRYTEAVGFGFGDKYYMSVKDESNDWHLFVFDTRKRLWHEEDDTQVKYAAYLKDDVFIINGDNEIVSIKGENGTEEGLLDWECVSGLYGLESPDGKYVGKIQLRVDIDNGERFPYVAESTFKLDIEYDSNNQWVNIMNLSSYELRSYNIPVPIRRCDHFRIKMYGRGVFTLYSMTLEIFDGGDYATAQ